VFERREQLRLFAAGGAVVLVAVTALVVARSPSGGAESGPALAAAWCAGAATPRPGATCPPPTAQAPSLRTLAHAYGLRIGSAVNTDALANDPRYAEILGREFSSLTAEDSMKWARLEPAPGVYNWAAADRLVEFAQRNGQQVYGHPLVWHASLPGWLTGHKLDRAEAGTLLRRHIHDEVTRYRGKVWAWDVVNEPLLANGELRHSVWRRALGPDYVADAFRWARAADPVVRLFINDFGIEAVNPKSDALYDLVRRLKARGVPIDGVGFQTHWTTSPLPSSFVKNLRRFAALGLDVAITEADVRIVGPPTGRKLKAQAAVYGQALRACLSVVRCVSFTVWGFTDKYSWVPGVQADAGAACLFDEKFRAKPAYAAIAAALPQRRP
jgi:endo-1,4-beta-xylanase